MKRDMDIVRHLLMWVENEHSHQLPSTASREDLAYHAQLLIDAGLVEGTVHYSSRGGRKVPDAFHIQRLTWAGHDFLDAAHDENVWHTAKEKILKSGVAWTFELLKDAFEGIGKAATSSDRFTGASRVSICFAHQLQQTICAARCGPAEQIVWLSGRFSDSKTTKMKTLSMIIAATLQVAIAADAETQTRNISFGQLPKNYQTVIRGYYSMPGHLLDPYSAVYRFDSPMKGYVKDGFLVGGKFHYGWIVPVWINAKNAFGGYTGVQRYYVMFFAENGNVGDVTEMFNLGRGKFMP
jgi:hypothetical protein